MNGSVVFFGNECLSTGVRESKIPVFKGLLAAGYEIRALILSGEIEVERRLKGRAIIEAAEAARVPIYGVKSKSELSELIKTIDADIGVLAAFGQIVPKSVIDHFRVGI